MDTPLEQSCDHPDEIATCTSVGTQYADVSLPVKVNPYAILGAVETDCCGEPTVTLRQIPGCGCGCGCEVMITQTICIKIPIEYGASAEAGELSVHCRRPPGSGCTPC